MSLFSIIPAWIFAAAVFLVIVVLLVRFSNDINVLTFFKNNFFYLFLLLFLAIFAISVINIHTSHDIDYSSLDGWKTLAGIYASWLWGVASNIGKITGYAMQQDWIANATNVTG